MNSNNRYRVLFLILCVASLTGYGCTGTVPIMPSPTVSTATQTSSPKPTATKTSTPDDVATAHFIETASINTIISTVKPIVLASYPSPDGKWRAEVIRYDCVNYPYQDYVGIIAYEQIKVVSLGDGTEKIIDDQLQNCDGIGGGGLAGLYWSPSNRYFYYTDWREGFPESCGNYIVPTIYRFDMISKEIITVGGGHISPDQTKLAMWQKNEIIIWDLDKGEIGRVRSLTPYILNGDISWSPDGQSLVYLQTTFDCAPDYGTTYVTRLDLAEMSQTLLLKFQPSGFGGVSWDIADQITLMDGDGKFWIYDLITKETLFLDASTLTPTPVPPGILALTFYPPLIMEYDISEWKAEPYLRARNLKTCVIGEQGPTDFQQVTPEYIQLRDVKYEVITFTESASGLTVAYYIENHSLSEYNYESGLPIPVVQASVSEWEECKALAEKVLSTLRVP